MAVRLRKLARQIGRTPAEVIGLLHALGFPRYRSSEDMVADPVAGKARVAARQGMKAAPVQPEAVPKAPRARAGKAAPDLMATLLPGVAPLGAPRPVQKTQPPKAPPAVATAVVAAPDSAQAPSDPALERLRGALLAAEQAARVAEQAAGAAEQAAEAAERARLATAAERDQALAQLEALRQAQGERGAAAVPGRSEGDLVGLLEARGLRGLDEQARALEALVVARRLDPAELRAVDPARVAALLRERLLLFDGDVPDGLMGVAGVSVSPDRADVPGAPALARRIERAAELMLLNGFKRLRAVGVPPQWHGLLRGAMDPRVDLLMAPGGPRDGARAAADAAGVDVVWLWGVAGDEAAREAWAAASRVVEGPASIGEALQALVDGLAS